MIRDQRDLRRAFDSAADEERLPSSAKRWAIAGSACAALLAGALLWPSWKESRMAYSAAVSPAARLAMPSGRVFPQAPRDGFDGPVGETPAERPAAPAARSFLPSEGGMSPEAAAAFGPGLGARGSVTEGSVSPAADVLRPMDVVNDIVARAGGLPAASDEKLFAAMDANDGEAEVEAEEPDPSLLKPGPQDRQAARTGGSLSEPGGKGFGGNFDKMPDFKSRLKPLQRRKRAA